MEHKKLKYEKRKGDNQVDYLLILFSTEKILPRRLAEAKKRSPLREIVWRPVPALST